MNTDPGQASDVAIVPGTLDGDGTVTFQVAGDNGRERSDGQRGGEPGLGHAGTVRANSASSDSMNASSVADVSAGGAGGSGW